MPATIVLLLEASTLLIVLPFFSQGEVNIDQVEFVNEGRKSWPVDGVATVEIGTGREFAFDCGLSNELSSCQNVWARTDGEPVQQHSTGISNQVQLTFDASTTDSLAEYVCYIYGCSEQQSIFLTVTEANPAVLPVQQDWLITANAGDNVSIEFKISSLPEVMPTDIKWFHDNDPISTAENFREDRRSLAIDNVQPSDAGHYRVEVCVGSQCEVQHTNLSVIDVTTMTTSQIITPTASSSNLSSLTPSPSTSSSSAMEDTSPTLGQVFSSSDQLTTPPSRTTTLPLPSSTTAVPPFSIKSVHSTSLAAQPGTLQTTPTATSPCSTIVEEDEILSEYITLVTAAGVLLATALAAIVIAIFIMLLLRRRGKKNLSIEEHTCSCSLTKSKEFKQSCDSANYTTTHKELNGHSKAALGKIIITDTV